MSWKCSRLSEKWQNSPVSNVFSLFDIVCRQINPVKVCMVCFKRVYFQKVPMVEQTPFYFNEIDGHAFHSLLKQISFYADFSVLRMQLIFIADLQTQQTRWNLSHVWKCFVRNCSMTTAVPSANCLANKSKFFSGRLDQTSIDFPQG